jgi:hypothetical protein
MKLLTIITVIICCIALTASAQVSRSDLVKAMEERHGERPAAWGLTSTGAVLEVFKTHDGANWTLIVTTTDGTSGILGSGTNWTQTPFKRFPCPRGNLCLDVMK